MSKTIRIPKPRDPFQDEIDARKQLRALAELRNREPKTQTLAEIAQQLRQLAEQAARIA